MDVLLETANTISKDNDESKGSKKRRAAERGFHGTLLSSFGGSSEDTTTISTNEETKIQSRCVAMPVDKKAENDDDHHRKPVYQAAIGPLSDENSVESFEKDDEPHEEAKPARKKDKTPPKQETETKGDEMSPTTHKIERPGLPNRENAETRATTRKKPPAGSVLENIGFSENHRASVASNGYTQDLVQEVSKRLLVILPGREIDCLHAAEWAVKNNNGSAAVDELIGVAFDRAGC
jgi:hypothetical protein